MAEDYSSILEGVYGADPLQSWLPSIPLGSHEVMLTAMKIKKSKKEMGNIVEGDFSIVLSDTLKVGVEHGWSWMINAPGYQGTYAKQRLQAFFKTAVECLGETPTDQLVRETGASLFAPSQSGRGLRFKINVTHAVNNKTGMPLFRKDGVTPVGNADWRPIAQTLEQLASQRATLDGKTVVATEETGTKKFAGLKKA